jgi:hypothetical protein
MLHISKNVQMINSICLTLKVFFFLLYCRSTVHAQFFKNKEGEVMKEKKEIPSQILDK